jgi:PAS domain S-box-containing protein
MIKPPGILYRISFLVILNSLFIFAAVTYVSFENNQTKIDRLINYKFDFISEYLRSELDDNYLAAGGEAPSFPDRKTFDTVFDRARKTMKGLGGLVLLIPSLDGDNYTIHTASYRESLDQYDPRMWDHIAGDFDREIMEANEIQVGRRFDVKSGALKTIYIPWNTRGNDAVLAITFIPDEIVGGDYDYNWTIILLFLVITLITLLIINLLFLKFIRPLRHLVQAMEKTAQKEVLCKIEDAANDEIGRVATAFNTMSTSLWDKRKQLNNTLVELSSTNKSLSESKAFLAKLIENAPFAVIATDPDRKILVFSKAAMGLFEMRVDEALGRDIVGFFPFAPEKVFPEDSEEDGVFQEEMICQKPNQENFPALVSRVPIRDKNSQVTAYLIIIRDISESTGFQEMLISIDRMATRGVMAGEIAHEINNYLAIILGNVELLPLLLDRGKMDKVERKLDVLRTTVTKIQRFSEGLMGYGNETAVFAPGDLNQLIENLVAFLRPQNRYDNIKFNLTLSPELPLVEFDSSQLQQLFVNLLNNAAEALREKDDRRAIVIATSFDTSEHIARVIIEDNARGLPEDLNEVIFEKRYTGKRRGRGFGLVIVKQIIDKHGGRIAYTTIPGEGTTFNIALPIKAKPALEETTAQQSRQVTT